MKKKILCFIFAFIFMFPFTFMLSGCFGENPPSDPPTTEQGGNGNGDNSQSGNNNQGGNTDPAPLTVQDVLTAFNAKVENDKYTADIAVEYTEKDYEITNNFVGYGKTDGLSLPNINLKVEGDNIGLNAPYLTETFIIDGNAYSYVRDRDEFFSDLTNQQKNSPYVKIVDTIAKIQNKSLVNAFVFIANTLDNCSATVSTTDNTTVLNINLDLANLANKLMSTFMENKSNKLSVVLNAMFKDITKNDGDILAVIDEFKQTYTDDTTAQDLNDFIKSKTGIDCFALSSLYVDFYDLYKGIETKSLKFEHLKTIESDQYLFKPSNTDKYPDSWGGVSFCDTDLEKNSLANFDPEDIAQTTLSSLVDTTDTNKTAKELVFEAIDNYLNNEQFSADMLIASQFFNGDVDKYATTISQIAQVSAKQAKLNTQIYFDSNYTITKVALDGAVDLARIVDEENNGVGIKYTGNLVATFKDYGSTQVTIPETSERLDLTIEYYVKAMDILNMPMISLNFVDSKIEDFDVVAYSYDSRTQSYSTSSIKVITYNSATKILSINKQFIQDALSTPNCNTLQLRFCSGSGFWFTLYLIVTE